MGLLRVLIGLSRRLSEDQRGNVITTFALATPVIAILALGGVDLASVSADKQKMQDVADSAALLAAKQLGMADNNGLSERIKATMAEQLTELSNRMTYTASVTPDPEDGLVQVQLVANRNSFFANMLPPGGWNFTITANAEQMGTTPLCVLSHGEAKAQVINLTGTSKVAAPGCLVHGNSDIQVTGSSQMSAEVVQASGLATGAITPSPQTDAPPIPDPFAGMSINPPGALCSPLDLIAELAPIFLLPGVHCGNVTAIKSGAITLLPGEHFFQKGSLTLQDQSRLIGDNVVLVFGRDAQFKFKDSSLIRLRGRRQGAYAGFVIATTRDNIRPFEISSSAARELLGTVYIPSSDLQITGMARVADQSAWTVIVARSLRLTQGPNLVINKNYAGSSVPLPGGVGDKATDAHVRLVN